MDEKHNPSPTIKKRKKERKKERMKERKSKQTNQKVGNCYEP